jgi:hypothetical protein
MLKIKFKTLSEATEKDLEHPAKTAVSSVIQHNIDFFKDNKDLISVLAEYTTAPFEEIIPKIEPFRMNKIVKFLGGGAMGKAFELSNGHVVKIFRDGVDTKDDIAMYREAYEKLHKGKATKFTLPVFYFNEVPKEDIGATRSVYYAEIPKVVPFDNFLKDRPDRMMPGAKEKSWEQKYYRAEVADFLIKFFVHTINKAGNPYFSKVDLNLRHLVGQKDFIDKFLSHIDEYAKQITAKGKYEIFKLDKTGEYADDIKNYKTLSRVEVRNLIKSLLQMHIEGRNLADAGARNLGVSPHGRENDPIFYIFDK